MSGNRNGTAGTADHLPTVYRPGALDALQCPSRMGDMLHYPDGRVERVEAVPAAQAPTGYGGAA